MSQMSGATLPTLPTVPSPPPQIVSTPQGAEGICAEDHISGGHGQIVWDYDTRQSDLAAWTAANGHACGPTAVWHPYHDDGGSGFWSDAEADWWTALDTREANRRSYNTAVTAYNAAVRSYNAAVRSHNAAVDVYNAAYSAYQNADQVWQANNNAYQADNSLPHPGPQPAAPAAPTFTHPRPSRPGGHPGPVPAFTASTVYADYANKNQGPLGCYPALPS